METFTRLCLIRHGQVVNYAEGVYNGHADVAMTDVGIGQIAAVAERLKNENISAVYCSDLVRSRKSAEIIAAVHNVTPVAYPSLRELDFGLWSGLTIEGVEKRFSGEMKARSRSPVEYVVPGGESVMDLNQRVAATVKKILAAHGGKAVALVAHGGVNRVVLAGALGLDLERFYSIQQDYGCLNIIDYFSDFAVVKLMNGQFRKDF